ncbi:OLC1v1001080C1 [Oldenlandia corymbosa var. corymbosa]|uniref:OLC1v1001080C1 n=1 Tax=Oldenlandia corymbosa var. corymbosa TaxID=529605 RepID=A0AAV1D4J3_OLDCO|nr:OLC1v1001080C1 [Oldenlandia corymbosa var. corymbosa]
MGPSPCVWSSQQRNPQFRDFGVKGRTYVGAGYGYGFGYGSSDGFGGVSGGLKRELSGTGVFLPRRYENNNYNSKASEYRKKSDKWMERFGCLVIGPGLGRDPFLLVSDF